MMTLSTIKPNPPPFNLFSPTDWKPKRQTLFLSYLSLVIAPFPSLFSSLRTPIFILSSHFLPFQPLPPMSTKTMTNSSVSNNRKEKFLHKLKLIGLVPQPQTYHVKRTATTTTTLSTSPLIKEDDDADADADTQMVLRCPPGGAEAVILYTTSLRSIRKTFEDCHSIRFLLQSFKVAFQERDVAMDLGFRDELWKVIGGCGRVIPPRLFIKGKYIGGADEVITLHEQGKLRKLFDGIPMAALPAGSCDCSGCGNLRFVVCSNCNGRRKVVAVGGDREGGGGGEGGYFVRCLECNENGLMKCRVCL